MKNKKFFYLQYNKINWENQEKTKINSYIYKFVTKNIILKKKAEKIRLFDMGFGVGFFINYLYKTLPKHYKETIIEGCEPSNKNYRYFINKKLKKNNVRLKIYNKPFLDVKAKTKFDFITSTYVFTHFLPNELKKAAKKIGSMLDKHGKFILVVANEKYLKRKLSSKKDLFIESNVAYFNGKKYKEILYYSDIPKIGKVIDYDREESFYIELFKKNGFKLNRKKNLNDNGFVCTIFVFDKS